MRRETFTTAVRLLDSSSATLADGIALGIVTAFLVGATLLGGTALGLEKRGLVGGNLWYAAKLRVFNTQILSYLSALLSVVFRSLWSVTDSSRVVPHIRRGVHKSWPTLALVSIGSVEAIRIGGAVRRPVGALVLDFDTFPSRIFTDRRGDVGEAGLAGTLEPFGGVDTGGVGVTVDAVGGLRGALVGRFLTDSTGLVGPVLGDVGEARLTTAGVAFGLVDALGVAVAAVGRRAGTLVHQHTSEKFYRLLN